MDRAATPPVTLPDGTPLPALGLGTWRLGESRATRAAEIAAVRAAIEMGWRLIDTAEMYGEGGAEEVVGEAVARALADGLCTRDELTVVSKVYPHHASRQGVIDACARSRARLRLDTLDLYLLHWRGGEPLADTVAGFEDLRRRGWIRHWGVSNFDVDDLEDLWRVPGGDRCAANQVYHSLGERGPEFALLPWMRTRRLAAMAYSPIDQGALAEAASPGHRALRAVADRHGATPVQVALAALIARPGVMPIPKAARADHLRENLDALALAPVLTPDDLATLDAAFPPPRHKRPLAMI